MNPSNESNEPKPTPESNEAPNAPVVSDVTPATTPNAPPEVVVEDEVVVQDETPAPVPVVPTGTKKPSNKKFVVALLLVILLALAAVAGVYYWQNQQLKDAQAENAKLTSQMSDAKADVTDAAGDVKDAAATKANEAASKAVSTDLVTGQVNLNKDSSTTPADSVFIGTYAITDNLTEAWVEYGTSASKLDTQTTHTSEEFGMGDAGTYSNLTFPVKKTAFQTKGDYYYRVAAKTKSGTTVYSGVAAFNTPGL